jgi:cell division protease FtsH
MSDVIGPVAYRDTEEHPFLGKEYREQREYSEETARMIDSEVQRFLIQADHKAMKTLSEYRPQLESLAKALVEKESLELPEITVILGVPVPRSDAAILTDGRAKAVATTPE